MRLMKRFIPKFSLLFVLFSLLGCTRTPLQVEIKYISPENLASYYVDTPDPCLLYRKVGQELIISWDIPKEEFSTDLKLTIFLNMRNYSERNLAFMLNCESGSKVISVANDDYFSTGGILSFLVEIQRDGVPLYVRKHQLYVKLIRFEEAEVPTLNEGLAPEEPVRIGPFIDDFGIDPFQLKSTHKD